ncbi:MAG TPA: VTT domain-containing protein [Marmoricola sp.]|nr:VTT domain-containing protein [Marmoricola sp.]
MRLLALTFGFAAISAIIPVFNMEAYIVLVFAKSQQFSALELSAMGSLGQNVGKLVWYYVARGVLDVPWLRRRLEDPKRKATYERWRGRVEGRPLFSGALTFVSAAIGFPPFFAIAAIAGSLRMNVVVFFLAGLVGRTLFFWALLEGVGLILP